MKNLPLCLMVLASICFTLSSCQSYRDQGFDKTAACKELKYQMIMRTPATTAQSSPKSWKERANRGIVNQSYRQDDCM